MYKMLEQKQKIELNEPALEEVVINSTSVKVKPYLKLSDQMALVSVYLEDYFSKEETRVLESEYKLVLGVIDMCTDIDIQELPINLLLGNYKLWENIKSKIKNYGEFRALLARTIDEKREERRLEKTLGSAVENLFEKLSSLLSTDISPESIEKVQQLLKDVEESKIFNKATEIYKDK